MAGVVVDVATVPANPLALTTDISVTVPVPTTSVSATHFPEASSYLRTWLSVGGVVFTGILLKSAHCLD